MANIFRYSLDFGAGYVLVNPFKNDLVWSNEVDINPVITRIKLSGSVTFLGDEYVDIITYRDAGNNYIVFKIEQDDSGWNIIFEGNADVRKKYDENAKVIVLNKFNSVNDPYSKILANYKTKYAFKDLALPSIVIFSPGTETTTLDAVKVSGTGLNPNDYKDAYDIEGHTTFGGHTDPRWAYFLFRSTDGGGHNFETMTYIFKTSVILDYTEIWFIVDGVYTVVWVKLPPFVGATDTFSWALVNTFNRFPDVINKLFTNSTDGLTFTEGTAVTYTGQSDGGTPYAWFNYDKYNIGEAAEIAQAGNKNSEISLKNVFDIMEKAFNLYWYIDGTALKFKHRTEIITSGTLDLSSITADLREIDYLNGADIPDIESFFTEDAKGQFGIGSNIFGIVEIFYRSDINQLSNSSKKEEPIPINTNVTAMSAGISNTGKNRFALVETITDSAPRAIYGTSPDLNARLSTSALFGHLNKSRFDDEADLATNLKIGWIPLIQIGKKPLLTLTNIKYHISLLTDYDMDKAITVAAGSGKTTRISQKLNTDYTSIDIEL